MSARLGRRAALRAAGALAAGGAAGCGGARGAAREAPVDRGPPLDLKKALKFDMIKAGAGVEQKFALAKAAGFDGVELPSPAELDRAEVVRARDRTGLAIHGVVDSVHWKDRLSSPDPAARGRGVDALKIALRDARAYGATTVLLVPGRVTDPATETFEQAWLRSQQELRKVLPLARELGVKIAIEVVWNDFLTTPEELCRYVDELKDGMVGAYFDASNVVKFGRPGADWVRALGPRLLKLDFKGYSHARQWVAIGDGDEDWPALRRALAAIGYRGWATAETEGGGPAELAEIARRMDKVLRG